MNTTCRVIYSVAASIAFMGSALGQNSTPAAPAGNGANPASASSPHVGGRRQEELQGATQGASRKVEEHI